LEVVRDGEVVGKLLVTTVESHSAAADIIPGSVVQGDSVRIGDRVRAPQVASPEPTPGPAAAPVAPAANPEPANPEPAEPAPAPAGDPEPEPAPSTEPFGG
jgi:hypothetical protein